MRYKVTIIEQSRKIVIIEADNVLDAEWKVFQGQGDKFAVGLADTEVTEIESIEESPEQC